MIDIQQKKSKIIEFLKESGPSLPVQVARTIQMDPVFASAILSELLSAKSVKTSHMKVGASPLYLIPGHEVRLEEKTENLKSIEREAQERLKSEKIIYDESEEPAIRVALRSIKDFAIPFKFKDKIVWKYAFAPQEEVDKILFKEEESKSPKEDKKEKETIQEETPSEKKDEQEIKTNYQEETTTEEPEEVPKAWEAKKTEINKAKEESIYTPTKDKKNIENTKKIESIFQEEPKEKKPTPKTFLEELEESLKNHNTTITSLEKVDKKEVVAIVESNGEPSMLFAFNKLRINESELMKCYKVADKKNLPYQIITKGDQTKKLTDTVQAYQRLLKINKLI